MRRVFTLLAGLSLLSCQSGLTDKKPLPTELDRAFFDCRVQPVLTRSCGALGCHGDEARYFKLYGRNRLRLELPESKRNGLMTDAERTLNYDMARAYVDLDEPEASFLLRKPLEGSKGGYYHGGASLYGQGNVFVGKDDPGYKTLAEWVSGAKEDPACKEDGSDQ